jgi:hypothetical protein
VAADVHSNANDPAAGEKAALAGTSGTPSGSNKYVTDADARNTNARTPVAHEHAGADISSGTLDGDRLPPLSPTKKAGVPATGTPTGKILQDGGAWIEIAAAAGAIKVLSLASTTLRNSNDTEKYVDNMDYTKLKEIRLDEPVRGVRINFSIKTGDPEETVWGRLRRNGVAIGTEWSVTSDVYTEFTEDFNVQWNAGDLIQIYIHGQSVATTYVYVKNMRIYYDRAIAAFGSWAIVSPLTTVDQTAYVMTNQDP